MRFWVKHIFLVVLMFSVGSIYGQCLEEAENGGVIISEISQGPLNSNAEFIELLVVGTGGSVNLNGTIIDDNSAPALDVGNEPGHIRLKDCFGKVKPGTIILLYNDAEPHPGIPASSSERLILLPFSNADCIEYYPSCPDHNSSSYDCEPGEGGDWNDFLPMRNNGDIIQVIGPGGGGALSWGDQGGFPDQHARSIAFIGSDDYHDPGSYVFRSNSESTPGLPNSDDNAEYGDEIWEASAYFDIRCGNDPLNPNDLVVEMMDGVGPYTISSLDPIIGQTTVTVDVVTFRNLPCGTYPILVRDSNGCTANCSFEIFAPKYYVIELELGDFYKVPLTPDCVEYSDCCLRWYPEENVSDVELLDPVIRPTESGTYSLFFSDENGEIKDEFTFEFVVSPKDLELEIFPSQPIICGNNSIDIVANQDDPYNNGELYIWTDNEGDVIGEGKTISIDIPGIYTIEYTDIYGNTKSLEFEVQSEDQIQEFLESSGFYTIDIQFNISGAREEPTSRSGIYDYTTDLDPISISLEYIDLANEIQSIVNSFTGFDGVSEISIILTDNQSICDVGISYLESLFNSSGVVVWAHINRADPSSETGTLGIKIKLAGGEVSLSGEHGSFMAGRKPFLTSYGSTSECLDIIIGNLAMINPIGGFGEGKVKELTCGYLPYGSEFLISPAGVPIKLDSTAFNYKFAGPNMLSGAFEGTLTRFSYNSYDWLSYYKYSSDKTKTLFAGFYAYNQNYYFSDYYDFQKPITSGKFPIVFSRSIDNGLNCEVAALKTKMASTGIIPDPKNDGGVDLPIVTSIYNLSGIENFYTNEVIDNCPEPLPSEIEYSSSISIVNTWIKGGSRGIHLLNDGRYIYYEIPDDIQNENDYTYYEWRNGCWILTDVDVPEGIHFLDAFLVALYNSGHVTLDIISVIPGLGVPADLINTLWYGLESDLVNAGISLAGVVLEGASFARIGGIFGEYSVKFDGQEIKTASALYFAIKNADESIRVEEFPVDEIARKLYDALGDSSPEVYESVSKLLLSDLDNNLDLIEALVDNPDLVKAWNIVKHLDPKIKLNPTILWKVDNLLTIGNIPKSKLESALNSHLGDILNAADEVNVGKILDRLNLHHVDEFHFDNIIQRLDNYPSLRQDLLDNPDWFDTFDDILDNPEKYWDILGEGNIPSGSPLAKWGQGFWWKNLRELANDFESFAALDKIEELFGSAYGTNISLKVTNNVTGEIIDIVPDFLAFKNGKYHIADAKFTTKANFSVEYAVTPNQGIVFDWIKNQTNTIVEVRAANSKLEDIPGISQGDILETSELKIDILKSKQNDNTLVEKVINYH